MAGIFKSIVASLITKGFDLPQEKIERFNELMSLSRLIKILNVNCVLDVGANRGQFVDDLRVIGFQGKIISFEPVRKVFENTFSRFSFDTNWSGYQIALGSEEKTMTIHIPKETVFSSFLESINTEQEFVHEQVQVQRLDQLLPTLTKGIESPRVFLKMDTQGYDLEVFKGASGCIDYIVGIQSEISIFPIYKNMPNYLDSLQTYEAAGFDLYNLSVVNRLEDGALLELNCYMRRKQK